MRLDQHGPLRRDWEERVRAQGLVYTQTVHPDGRTRAYWCEDHSYVLTPEEVDHLEEATAEIQRICLAAVEHVIVRQRWSEVGIPPELVPLVTETWRRAAPTLYGRLDLSWAGGAEPPKLLEYNADTPTGLVEAAVVQWYWLEDCFAAEDQWNSLHERLVAAWRGVAPALASPAVHLVYTTADASGEDHMTVAYLAETASQAGLQPVVLPIEDLGFAHSPAVYRFVDLDERIVTTVFKLYPWEWLYDEADGPRVLELCRDNKMQWIEPAWKLLLSSKGLLPILWELFPGHPNLLPAYLNGPTGLRRYAIKAMFGREGRGVTLCLDGQSVLPTLGPDGRHNGEVVYQAAHLLPDFGRGHVCLGSWLVAGEPAGLGIRESDRPVTDNFSRFVPHRIATD